MSRSPVWVRTLEELSVIHLLGFPISSIATGAFLVPSLAFLDLARAGESAGLCLVKFKKSLAL